METLVVLFARFIRIFVDDDNRNVCGSGLVDASAIGAVSNESEALCLQ